VIASHKAIEKDLYDHTGWRLEVATSYVRLLRTSGRSDSTQPPLPTAASEAHLLILVCGQLRERVQAGELAQAGDDFFFIGQSDLELIVSDLHDEHSGSWKKAFRTTTASRLVQDLVPEMIRWGLLRPDAEPDRFLVTPLVARLDGVYVSNRTDNP
jgi:hypothetical protein